MFANVIRKLSLRFDRYESPADLEHMHDLDPEALGASLREAGFENVSVSHHDWLTLPLQGSTWTSRWAVGVAIVTLLHAE